MTKEWSTLTFSKLWTFPWKIFTHLSLGANGLTSQIRTATEPGAEGMGKGKPQSPELAPHCPKATGTCSFEALLWQDNSSNVGLQKYPDLLCQNGAIMSLQEGFLHPDTALMGSASLRDSGTGRGTAGLSLLLRGHSQGTLTPARPRVDR